MKHLEILYRCKVTGVRIFATFTITLFFALTNHYVANGQSLSQSSPTLIVRIDSTGQLYIMRSPVTRDQLRQSVISFSQKNRCGIVVLAASSNAKYDSVLTVIDVFRAVGVERIALGFPADADGVFKPVDAIVELNQIAPPTIGSLAPSNCSKPSFEIPPASPLNGTPQVLPPVPPVVPLR